MRPARDALRLPKCAEWSSRKKSAPRASSALAAQPGKQRHEQEKQEQPGMHAKESAQGEFGRPEIRQAQEHLLSRNGGLVEQQPAVFRRRVVARELDQVAAVQEIAQQRLVVAGERGTGGECIEKFDRGLARDWQLILLGHVTAQNIGNANAELIRSGFVDLRFDPGKQVEGALAWGFDDGWPIAPALDQPGR